MKAIEGNLIELAKKGVFDVIVHGCNCMCQMGAGIAQSIKKEFPEAFAADCKTGRGDRGKLGTCTAAEHGNVTIVNAYTQYDYRTTDGRPAADYDAIRRCMRWIRNEYSSQRIGMPKIGAGLARGDWAIISQIIEEELEGIDVTIVVFSEK